MARYRISGVPITENGKLVGILTNRDLRFETNFDQPIKNVMTKDNLVTAPVGTDLGDGQADFWPSIASRSSPSWMRITIFADSSPSRTSRRAPSIPNSARDSRGRLLCGAAVGVTKPTPWIAWPRW